MKLEIDVRTQRYQLAGRNQKACGRKSKGRIQEKNFSKKLERLGVK
jgi:hypothetical protein